MSSSSPYCPFCSIAKENAPFSPSSPPLVRQNDNSIEVHTDPILSTENVLAFLDIMPLTRGHVLLIPRRHHTKMSNLPVREAMEIGKWLPIMSRVVTRTVLGHGLDARGEDLAHWNVVQNNGHRAAQSVPHVHFHIIPRPDTHAPPSTQLQASFVMFGRGPRDDLEGDETVRLTRLMRAELAEEVARVREQEGLELDGGDEKSKL